MLTRASIKEDNKSRLALLIKSAWQSQKENGISESIGDFGKWPVSHEKFIAVSLSFINSELNDL